MNPETRQVDYITNNLKKVENGYVFVFEENEKKNNNFICENSIGRVKAMINSQQKSWALLSAFRATIDGRPVSNEENANRNGILRNKLKNLGYKKVYQFIGGWEECQDENIKNYRDCPPEKKRTVVERSFCVIKPNEMSDEEFKNDIFNCLTIDGATQDAALLAIPSEGILRLEQDGRIEKIGSSAKWDSKVVTQAWSKYVRLPVKGEPQIRTFVVESYNFLGVEVPTSISGARTFVQAGLEPLLWA